MTLIEIFKKIRDIPFRISLNPSDEGNCCTGKVNKFKALLDENGYESRYRICEFRWSDFDLPEKVSSLPHDDDSNHVFLEIKIDGKWTQVDPSWDKALESILPVNEWDGKSNTEIAVKSGEIYDVEKSAIIMTEETSEEEIKRDLKVNGEFYKAFNEWLEENRS